MKIKKVICLILICLLILPVTIVKATDLEVSAPMAILMDGRTGKVLYEKHAYEKAYPASLTKMLTAIVVVENCSLTDIVTYSGASQEGLPQGYIVSNLTDGEQLTVEQMLNLLLISSYNDIANVLAIHVAGSIEAFTELMNKKAEEIGCKNSHFTNTNGLHEENHYTTAYDMALISREAMKHESLREIVAKIYYELGSTNKYSGTDRIYETTNGLLLSGNETGYYEYARGIKTGFTTPAGSCLASYAVKNNMELYAVVLKCTTAEERYVSLKSMYEYGFDRYKNETIATAGENVQTIDIKGATLKTKKMNAVLEEDIIALVDQEALYTIAIGVELNNNLKAPIQKGTQVGTVKYEIDGITYEANLVAGNDVEKSHMLAFFIFLFLTLIIIFGTIKTIENHRKKIRMNKIRNM